MIIVHFSFVITQQKNTSLLDVKVRGTNKHSRQKKNNSLDNVLTVIVW